KVSKGSAEKAKQASQNLMRQIFTQSSPSAKTKDYRQRVDRAAPSPSRPSGDILKPTGLQMARFDLWLDADKQAAMFPGWLLDERWRWMTDTLGLVVDVGKLPRTISANKKNPNRANIEIHSVRTAIKRGALGLPEPHIVVVITQWRAGYFDTDKQK